MEHDTLAPEDMGRICEKLRKVMALTTSPVEGEAQAAAIRLQQMLEQYNLSIADLEKRGKSAPKVREERHDLGKAAFKWKLDLAEGIASFHYCHPLVDRTRKTVAFVGRPDNVEALQMLYVWIMDRIKEIARKERERHHERTGEHIDPLRWQVGFGEGAVSRLVTRMREMKERQKQDASRNEMGDVTALALHHASEVGDYMEQMYGYRTDGKKTRWQQEQDDRWAKQQAAKADLKKRCEESGDMEPYYECYPYDRPEVVKAEKEANDRYWAEWEKKEARNAKRRKGSYREKKVDWEKEDQSRTARSAGRNAADSINLQPFIGGQVDKNNGKIGR